MVQLDSPTIIRIFIVYALFFSSSIYANSMIHIRIQEKILAVEFAKTPDERAIGLMNRKSLDDGSGMLFIFEKPQILSFWMKNTYIPLSIAFFDVNRKLINIEQMNPTNDPNPPVHQSTKPAMYALEVPQGWFEKNSIHELMRFEWEKSKAIISTSLNLENDYN